MASVCVCESCEFVRTSRVDVIVIRWAIAKSGHRSRPHGLTTASADETFESPNAKLFCACADTRTGEQKASVCVCACVR